MNASSVRDREREELQKLAKLATESKTSRPLPPPTLSADSSGYVDLSALNLGNPNWIDEALRRTPPAVPSRPGGASSRAPGRGEADASAALPRDSFPSDPQASIVPHALDSLDFPDDDEMGLTAPPMVAGRPKRLAPFVATVFVLCVVLCGFALRRVVLNRAAEADAARAVVSAGPSTPPVLPDIPPPPPVTDTARTPVVSAPPPAPAATGEESAAPAVSPSSKKPAHAVAPKKKRAPHAAAAPAPATATPARAKMSVPAPATGGAKSLDDAIQQSFAPSAKTHK